MRLGERTDGPGLPEGAAGVRGRAVGVDCAVRVADEVVEASIVPLHVQNEIDEPGGPISQPAIPGIAPEVEEKNRRAGGVVHAGDTLETSVARRERAILVVRVHADGAGASARGGHATREARELPKRCATLRGWRGSL